MIFKIKSKKAQQSLVKQINWALANNFFTLEKLQGLRVSKIFKVIKLIAKIENKKLTRKEIKTIAYHLKFNLFEIPEETKKLWSFVDKYQVVKQVVFIKLIEIISQIFSYCYLKERFELMLN